MNSKLGFNLVAIDSKSHQIKDFALKEFNFFDINPSHLEMGLQVKSLQGIFYGFNMENASLLGTVQHFDCLLGMFIEVCNRAATYKIESIIFGAQILRKKIIDLPEQIILKRVEQLFNYAKKYNIKLYVEALNTPQCNFINNHRELLEIHRKLNLGKIHLDLATMKLSSEDLLFIADSWEKIERFHISEPNYTSQFVGYHDNLIEIAKFLIKKNVFGTIEILKFNDKSNVDIHNISKLLNELNK